jgi:cellulose synthase/poly-beta-1,6-N-acetylglucosamine synthase-like glycosyltransferase
VIILVLGLVVSIIAIIIFSGKLSRALNSAPKISIDPDSIDSSFSVSVIIPAYNEAANIEACVTSVLESTDLEIEVWVVDDQSTDETAAIVELLQGSRLDPRLKLLSGKSRPGGKIWVGKNWACTQAVQQVQSEFLLFIDADVRLKSKSIETAIAYAQQEKIDLLSLAVVILCRHWSEWLVQPIVVLLLGVGFDFAPVNDPTSDTAFAAGPFMLFRRSAYDAIGGHAAVHDQVVEDVELSRRIKQQHFKLWYGLGANLAEAQMYQSFSALWEGWTKNWFMGSNRNYQAALYCVFVTFMIFALPWIGIVSGLIDLAFSSLTIWNAIALSISAIGIFLQYRVRRESAPFTTIPLQNWWMMGAGGLVVCAIVLTSIIKTETGWGWTWRGRQLERL